MKHISPRHTLLLRALTAGLLGMVLRCILYRIGFDEKGILPASHPLNVASLLLAGASAVYLWLQVRRLTPEAHALGLAEGHPLHYLLHLAAAGCMAAHAFTLRVSMGSLLSTVRLLLTLGSAFCMVMAVCLPRRSTAVSLLGRGVICVCFALDMLCRYQGWSGNPQLPDYFLHVFACVFLALFTYQDMACDAGLGRNRTRSFCALTAMVLCVMCISGPDPRYFYAGGALWAAACLAVPAPPEALPEPEAAAEPEAEEEG